MQDFLKQIPISETLKKIIALNKTSLSKNEITEEASNQIKNLSTSIGDITLNQIYNYLKKYISEKFTFR
jgi:hypothetical protein